jgi:excisionase family DNA binding protein
MGNGNQTLLNARQAAKFLSVSIKTIRRWAQKGSLIGLKVGPRGDWRFTKEELSKMIKKPKL